MLRNATWTVRISLGAAFGVACACTPRAASPVVPSRAPADADGSRDASVPPPPSADPATLAVPGPAAASCTSDATCASHRCNTAYGKCAFPCASDADCVPGASCFKAVISTCQTAPPDR